LIYTGQKRRQNFIWVISSSAKKLGMSSILVSGCY